MRVLYVCADRGIPFEGTKGASVHVRQTVSALKRAGVKVDVLMGRGPRTPPRDAPADDLANQERDWMLHCAGLARRWEYRPKEEAPATVVYERYSLWSLAGILLARRLNVPLLVEVNAPLPEEEARYRHLELKDLARRVQEEILRAADAVLCVSSPLCQRTEALRGKPHGIFLRPNSVDTALFRPASRAQPGRDPTVTILCAGGFKPWHGDAALLKAFAQLTARRPNARLRFVGDGPTRADLEQEVRKTGLSDRVTFTGAMPHERVAGELSQADIAVALREESAETYFSPLKLGEALSTGLAVVTNSLGDRAGALIPGRDLLLVPPGSHDALVQTLLQLLDDSCLRRTLGQNARAAALKFLDLDRSTQQLMALISACAAAGPGIKDDPSSLLGAGSEGASPPATGGL